MTYSEQESKNDGSEELRHLLVRVGDVFFRFAVLAVSTEIGVVKK